MNKFLIVGLGNVGDEYVDTRHNIGFLVADALAAELDVKFSVGRHAYVADAKIKNKLLKIIKPTTYMNLSGKAVKYWMQAENIPIENILVITDDVDLDVGVIRLRTKGSGGSHNGLNHIIETLETTEWSRLRFGIGKNYARGFQIQYVLSRWEKSEVPIILKQTQLAVQMIKSFVLAGPKITMNQYNNKTLIEDDI